MSEPYEPGDGDGGRLDPWMMDPGGFAAEVRAIAREEFEGARAERERTAEAQAQAEQIVASHAEGLDGFEADYGEVEEQATAEVHAIAMGFLQQQGLDPQQAERFLRGHGDVAGFGLVAEVYGISQPQLAELALRTATQSAFAQAPARGDESGVLAKYQRMAAGPPHVRPASGELPGWARDLVNRV